MRSCSRRVPTLARDLAIAAAALVILLLLPYVWPSRMINDLVIRVSAFALFATSLNLLVGYTGMVSFGHGMFFGFGAYAFGLSMQKLGTSIPIAFVITIVTSALPAASWSARSASGSRTSTSPSSRSPSRCCSTA